MYIHFYQISQLFFITSNPNSKYDKFHEIKNLVFLDSPDWLVIMLNAQTFLENR